MTLIMNLSYMYACTYKREFLNSMCLLVYLHVFSSGFLLIGALKQ